MARRQTCTIIGAPLISANGLPGSRVDAIRAGMRTIAALCGMAALRVPGLTGAKGLKLDALIRVASTGAKPVVSGSTRLAGYALDSGRQA